jgi:hypothetical protein
MSFEPQIRPLSVQENIYALCDEKGRTIGTGTREVCEVLMYIMTKTNGTRIERSPVGKLPSRSNVRAAIAI